MQPHDARDFVHVFPEPICRPLNIAEPVADVIADREADLEHPADKGQPSDDRRPVHRRVEVHRRGSPLSCPAFLADTSRLGGSPALTLLVCR